ncbi:MAG: hypothetical protein H6744_03460 [Deltaproteobacteria bacterium]|nr:hypothetical protein [Deltaproteobacteria bacterium]MCB9785734.1 hypothetical protein [Deltaproteobacteria bacterium]
MSGNVADRVVSAVEPTQVAAGSPASVTCTVFDDHDRVVVTPTTFEVSPAEGRTVEGATVLPTKVGTYTAVCSAPAFEMVDPTGATLEVVAGDPARVTAILDHPQVAVFEKTNVTCAVEDAYGNVIEGGTQVVAPEGVAVADHQVSSDAVGEYSIGCAVAGFADIEVVPATLVVTAGDPATVELIATPMRESYIVGLMTNLSWIVRDAHGNVIPNVPGTLTIPQPGITVVDEALHRVRFDAEGRYTFTVRLDAPWEALTDDLTLISDESGPVITIPWPQRGETVQGQGGFLTIEGTVIDAFGEVDSFTVNGKAVPVAADGSFSLQMLPRWGVNLIDAHAADGFGNVTKLTPTFAYSSEYLSYVEKDAQGVKQDDGLELLVGQDFLDDGDHDPTHVNDLATMLEVLLGDLDLLQLVQGFGNFDLANQSLFQQNFSLGPLQIVLDGTLQVTASIVDPTDIGPTMVTIDSRLGGIDSSIEIGDAVDQALVLTLQLEAKVPVTLDISVFGFNVDTSLTGGATLYTQVSLDSLLLAPKIDIQKTPGGQLVVEVVQFDTGLTGLEIDPIQDVVLSFDLVLPQFLQDLGLGPYTFSFALSQLIDLTQLTDAILDPITSQFLPFVIDLVEPFIQGFVDDILVTLLEALKLETSIDLPELLGPKPQPIALDLYTDLTSVQFTDDGGQIGLGLGLYADKGVEREPLGAIQRDGCLTGTVADFAYGWQNTLGGAIKTDAINSALFAVWWSGFLNGPLDLGGLLGGGGGGGIGGLPINLEDFMLDMDFLLTPILSDCTAEGGSITVQVGDLHAFIAGDLLGAPLDAEVYIDLALPLEFSGGADGLSVTVGQFEFFDVEVIDSTEDVLGLFDVRDLLENQLGGILGSFLTGQTFGPIALPPIDLGGLIPGLPTSLTLELGDLDVSKDQGYVVISGDLK